MTIINKSRVRQWLLLALFSAVMVPVAVSLGGLIVAGNYEGEAGFFGLAGGIYTDAITGHLPALILLFSPLLLVLIWQLSGAVYRAICKQQSSTQTGNNAPAG